MIHHGIFCTGHLTDGTRFYGELTGKQFHGFSGDEEFDVTIDSDVGTTGVTLRRVTVSAIRDMMESTPQVEHMIFLVEGTKRRQWTCNPDTDLRQRGPINDIYPVAVREVQFKVEKG